jgi:hypothetical protein
MRAWGNSGSAGTLLSLARLRPCLCLALESVRIAFARLARITFAKLACGDLSRFTDLPWRLGS